MEIIQGGPTKPEIAAIVLSKLELSGCDVIADIGCGTGCISIMAARSVAQVYAIDSRDEAVTAAGKNIRDAGIRNIALIQGEAPSVLSELPLLDGAFVGGSRNIEDILHVLKHKVRGRIVVNAVRIQTVSTVIQTMQKSGMFQEAVHVQVSKSHPLAGEIMFKPINPVYIIIGETRTNRRNADC